VLYLRTGRVGACEILKEGEIVKTNGLGSRLQGVSGSCVICLFLLAAFFNSSMTGLASGELQLPDHKSADPWANLLPLSNRNSLLDPSKLDISHQLIFSYYSGAAGKGDTGGLFLTRLQYPLASPLMLDLTIGSSLTHTGLRGVQSNELFIQNFSLRYAPNDKFLLMFMYDGAPYNRIYFPTH